MRMFWGATRFSDSGCQDHMLGFHWQTNTDNKSVIPANAGIHGDKRMKMGYVYILASRKAGTLYIGVTSNLINHVAQHQTEVLLGFTKRYRVHRLVYYEICDDIRGAIAREKQIKNWKRAWKIELIEKNNPSWRDLYGDIVG